MYVSLNCIIIGSGNGLPPLRQQAITWTNAELLPTGPREQISMKFDSIFDNSHKKMDFKI